MISRPRAHTAASATTGSPSPSSASTTGSNSAAPLFPAAYRQFRTNRPRPIRLIGEPENTCRNPASSSASRSARFGRRQLRPRREGQVRRRRRRELVPRAHRQAVVAPVDAVAQAAAELLRHRPRMLDRQVGDAPPRIEPERRGEGVGRARPLAGVARAAGLRRRHVRRQRQRRVDRAQEQPVAVLAADEVGMLPLPPQPRRPPRAASPSPARCRRTP